MTQNTPAVPTWFITEENRAKAQIKNDLPQLLNERNLSLWLTSLVNFWNKNTVQPKDLSVHFREWQPVQQQSALDFFSTPALVDLVNAIFFYKLYPDKLFNQFVHPEKLVSVRMRLGLIHRFIEMLQQQLYSSALQQGLSIGIDYLFHGDELPQGIMIEVNEDFRAIIQSAVKQLKLSYSPENEAQVTIERLHDLALAYRFWFNPNRLIDAVMVLEQRLVKNNISGEHCHTTFQQEMVLLYGKLTATECLNLYGYFANNDTRYLLYTLLSIMQGHLNDWLPVLHPGEKKAIASVFNALHCVMEALREALKTRHVTTEPFVYDLAKEYVKAGRRNRDAVFRILAIYTQEAQSNNDRIEKLLSQMEET